MGAGSISWLLAQTSWVGGLWLLHFVVLPGLEKMGLAPMLVDEAGAALRPLLVGFAGFCGVLQLAVLLQETGWRRLLADLKRAGTSLALSVPKVGELDALVAGHDVDAHSPMLPQHWFAEAAVA